MIDYYEMRSQPISYWYIHDVLNTFVIEQEEPPQKGGASCVKGNFHCLSRFSSGHGYVRTKGETSLGDSTGSRVKQRLNFYK